MAGGGNRVVVRFIGEDSDLRRDLEELQGLASSFADRFNSAGQSTSKFAQALAVAQRAVETTSVELTNARLAEAAAAKESTSATAALTAAASKAADAAGKQAVAEVQLQELRESGRASASRLAQAEERVNSTRRASELAASRVTDAERRVEESQRDVALTYGRSRIALDRHRQALADLHQANQDADHSTRFLSRAFDFLRNSALNLAEGAIANLKGGLWGLAGMAALAAAAMPVVGAALALVVAGAGAAAFGLGTVILGLDGIKKAAKVLVSPLNALKKSISAVFEAKLTPVFKELAGVLPKLEGGFKLIATALSGVVKNVVDFIASKEGVKLLQDALKGAAAFITPLGDGLKRFVDGFLTALVSAGPQMEEFGKAVGELLGGIGDAFKQAAADGSFQQALKLGIDLLKLLGVGLQVSITYLLGMAAAVQNFREWVVSSFQASAVAVTGFASQFLGMASQVLGGISEMLHALARIPGPWQSSFAAAAAATDRGKQSIDALRASVDQVHDKAAQVQAATSGEKGVMELRRSIDGVQGKTVYVNVIARGGQFLTKTPGRAVGGTVNKGRTYLVGERGPELLTMPGSGSVTPNHQLGRGGGGGGVTTVNFVGNTSDALATVIMEMIRTRKIVIA